MRVFCGFIGIGLLAAASATCGNAADEPVAVSSRSDEITTAGGANHDLPVKHVIVILKENHTFDNYFGTFPGAEGSSACRTTKQVIPGSHAPNVTPRDLPHGHADALADWNGGAMDGWLSVRGASEHGDNLFCAQYGEKDIPAYWAYARAYGLADHFFANTLGPSFPGHAFVVAAQAAWATDNPTVAPRFPYWGCDQASNYRIETLARGSCTTSFVRPCFDIPSVPTLLPPGVDWRFYGTTFDGLSEVFSVFDAIRPVRETALWNNVVNASTFEHDVVVGYLPAVTWLVDEDRFDEHPGGGAGVCDGENWTAARVNALMRSPLWKDSVVLLTMDDFGGWYDHVAPPRRYGCDTTQPYGLGFRLPLIVMSPYVKRGIYKTVAEQASIVKFILKTFHATQNLSDLDPAAQDGQANDLMDMFDWKQAPLDPLVLPPRNCSQGIDAVAAPGELATATDPGRSGAGAEPRPRLKNRIAYIPPQCFAKTRVTADDVAKNTCYPCHTRAESPNYTNDDDLQLTLSFPLQAKTNPWTNLLDPPVARVPPPSDDEILAYVRTSNYFDDRGSIALAETLASPSAEWDTNANGKWDGFTPDLEYRFDDHGFDHRPDGSLSGWRAFAYYPFPGAFFPTNGSADDVAIRLDPVLQQDRDGRFDRETYEINLAIVEALVRRTDVVIDPVDETTLGVDLDLDGHLGPATRVAFDAARDGSGRTRMHYVGRAHDEETRSSFPIAPGLFPLGTEFFHTVRYLDVGSDGVVTMAPRMKEVRYAKKVRWVNYETARADVLLEAQEQDESSDGTHEVRWENERGIFTGSWRFQGFIENSDGSLRPQTFEETASCAGCHSGIGATTDSTFSFARKIDGAGSDRGWFHWSAHDLRGIEEPKRADGEYEYTFYLRHAGAADDLHENTEVEGRFFDDRGALRPAEIARLHRDISALLLPSPARALDLDRAYKAIVQVQSFDQGRDAVLAPSANAYSDVPLGASTGLRRALVSEPIAPRSDLSGTAVRAFRGERADADR